MHFAAAAQVLLVQWSVISCQWSAFSCSCMQNRLNAFIPVTWLITSAINGQLSIESARSSGVQLITDH